jgi:hypothetical protein
MLNICKYDVSILFTNTQLFKDQGVLNLATIVS